MRREADEKVKVLSGFPLFQGCSPQQLREVARLAERVDVDAGAVLTREGGVATEFFGIVEGSAVVSRGGSTVARLGSGDYFGEVGVLAHLPRDAEVTAETAMRLVVVEQRAFMGLLADMPALNRALMQGVARRLHRSDVADGRASRQAVAEA